MTSTAQSAIVVGGASGIGEATARKLASRGISVCIADRNEEQAKAVANDITVTYNVRAKHVHVDVANEDSVKSAVEFAARITGRLDFAANCAGICESIWEEERSFTVEVFDR